MKQVLPFLTAVILVACTGQPPGPAGEPVPPAGSGKPAAAAPPAHLRPTPAGFVRDDGRPFIWRGITAFRLLDYVADGEEARAIEYLRWARRQGLTVVRVFAMLEGFFNLPPEQGRATLPRLLVLAAQEDVHVEVVALTGTATHPVDPQQQTSALGAILARHANGLLELANEPFHPSQRNEIKQAPFMIAMAKSVPEGVPVSLGSVETGEGFEAGDYITWHAPRSSEADGWGHVLELAAGAGMLERWKKPVVSDEPIGAGAEYQPGRRDNVPARFRAAALLTRLAGLGATFHYEGGLHATIPQGRELECLTAWMEAWTLLPSGVEREGVFRAGGTTGAVVLNQPGRAGVLGVYERVIGDRAWILIVGGVDAELEMAAGWRPTTTQELDGIRLIAASRSK